MEYLLHNTCNLKFIWIDYFLSDYWLNLFQIIHSNSCAFWLSKVGIKSRTWTGLILQIDNTTASWHSSLPLSMPFDLTMAKRNNANSGPLECLKF
jgi:hypothetical protein